MDELKQINIRLVIEYDGTEFCGSQAQSGQRTVQSELERCLRPLTNEDVRVTFAGRTDSGVHAKGQVANFRTSARHEPQTYLRALNATLPVDMAVRSADLVPGSFHSRFDAVSREYRYAVHNHPVRSPLLRRYAFHVVKALDIEAMRQSCWCFCGEHDFASFTGAGHGVPDSEGAGHMSTVRRVQKIEVTCAEVGDAGRLIEIEIVANAFLPHMVRNLVGTLLWVGTGRIDWRETRKILEARDRRLAAPTAPPHGLCLTKVNYPVDRFGPTMEDSE